jgi:ATP-dependent 26S proteasome regulatory subunit
MKSLLFKRNIVILEGRRSFVTTSYDHLCNISEAYSNRFKAIWYYILNNIDKNDSIYSIKETHTNYSEVKKGNYKRDNFMVLQNKNFILKDNIYAVTELDNESNSSEKESNVKIKTEKIIIYIYSYTLSLNEIKKFIDTITDQYLISIKNNRLNKKFIYSVDKLQIDKHDDSRFDYWREDMFESSRTFNNIFFDNKKQIMNKIDFFLHNKNWYDEKGIPYSLGICLHGPPGTGKTSFIKALANYTDRHIILLSLKVIKTKKQLETLFFENTYNDENEIYSIGWDKKIFVFEDIDCIGDIVLNREEKEKGEQEFQKKNNKIRDKNLNDNCDSVKVGDIIQSICELNETSVPKKDQQITLDDILNLWDGIRETPGRILIISTNHYSKLDPALVRPGRVDISLELTNASHNTISDIYYHLFDKPIDKEKLCLIKEYFYSPAELINIYVKFVKNEDKFLETLINNSKV